MESIPIIFELQIKMSFWDALKLRLAGGKYMEQFWRNILKETIKKTSVAKEKKKLL